MEEFYKITLAEGKDGPNEIRVRMTVPPGDIPFHVSMKPGKEGGVDFKLDYNSTDADVDVHRSEDHKVVIYFGKLTGRIYTIHLADASLSERNLLREISIVKSKKSPASRPGRFDGNLKFGGELVSSAKVKHAAAAMCPA